MQKRARKYVCPDCGYRKEPTIHSDCGGTIVLDEATDRWICESCGDRMTAGSAVPAAGGHWTRMGEHVMPTFIRD